MRKWGNRALLRRYYRIVFLLILTTPSVIIFNAIAEERTIHGVKFRVDSLQDAGNGFSEVEVGDKKALIANGNVDLFIVENTLQNRTRISTYSPQVVRQLLQSALLAGDMDIARAALHSEMHERTQTSQPSAEQIESLWSIGGAKKLFSSFIETQTDLPPAKEAFAEMLLLLGINDVEWFRASGMKWAFSLGTPFRELLLKRFFEALVPNDFSEAGKVLDIYSLLYGESESIYRKLAAIHVKLSTDGSKKMNETLGPLLQILQTEGAPDSSFAPALLSFIHGRVEVLLKGGEPIAGLDLLARIQPNFRSHTTVALMREALHGAPLGLRREVLEPSVLKMIEEVTASNQVTRMTYVGFIARQVTELFIAGRGDDAEPWFKELLKVNPDPSQENDELRLTFTSYLVRAGRYDEAAALLGGIRNTLGIKGSFQIILLKLKMQLGLFTIALIGVSLLLFAMLLRQKGYLRDWSPKIKLKKNVGESEEWGNLNSDLPPFVKVVHGIKDTPEYREYIRLLYLLELPTEASQQEIKTAYRKLVKIAHPDMKGEKASERFVELQQTYEKILELDKEFGFSRRS